MTQLKNILNDSGNTFFKLLVNWTAIAGKSNREIMKPNRITKKVLYVAVPNNMALKIVRRLEPEILKNVQVFSGKTSVKEIRFFSDPSKFPDIAEKTKKTAHKPTKLDNNEVEFRSSQLKELGIDSSLSRTMAEIDLILKKQKENK